MKFGNRVYAKEWWDFAKQQGVVQSGCTKITGRSATKEFHPQIEVWNLCCYDSFI